MDGGFRKGKAKWNRGSKNGPQRESVGIVPKSKVRDGESWRCLYPAGIPDRAWYRMLLWIKLDTKAPIMSSMIDLAQAREGWRFHDSLSMHMYEKM